MTFNLLALLPELLPGAIEWAELQSQKAVDEGRGLTEQEQGLVKIVGVKQPEEIYIRMVNQLPLPEEPRLKDAALQTGLLGPNMVGLTLGHSIFIVQGHFGPRLFSHECRHVYQYEMHGTIADFLPIYLQQIATIGYESAPLEKDARAHEVDIWPRV